MKYMHDDDLSLLCQQTLANTAGKTGNTPNHTTKPCYRKDDRAMRLIYGCPEKNRPSRPRLLFPKLLTGSCCDRSYERAYKIWSS